MNRWWSRFVRPEAAFFLLFWLLLAYLFRTRAFIDPGALWHVRVGELILADGFMRTDPFSYTFAGQTWIPQQWGGEVLMALAHGVGGFDAMLLGFCAVVAGLFTWVFSRAVRNGMHPALAAVVTGGAMAVSAFHFYARPHLFTIVGMGVTMAAITDFERGRATAWRLWWLIPFNVLWTNIHGGVLGGVLTLGLAVAGWGVVFLWNRSRHLTPPAPLPWEGRGEKESPPSLPGKGDGGLGSSSPINSWRTAFLLVAVVAACGLTPVVNPFGLEMLRTWQKIVGSEAMKEMVSEHQPLSLSHTAGKVVVGYAAFYLFALLGTLPNRPRVSWLLPLVWFALSVKGIRQGPLFAVIGAVAVADIWPHTVWHRLLKKYGDSLARDPEAVPRRWTWAAIPVALLLLALGVQAAGVKLPLVGRGWAGFDPAFVPGELAEPLREYARTTAEPRLFNDANLGGFVIYHAPRVKVFMDDRFELYGDPWLREYVAVVYDHPERFEEWVTAYHFDHALVSVCPGADRVPLEKFLSESPRWVVVSRCDSGALFRRLPEPAPATPDW